MQCGNDNFHIPLVTHAEGTTTCRMRELTASSDPSPCILVCSLGWMWVYACSYYGLNSLHYSLSIWICFEFELQQWCFRVFLEHLMNLSTACFANYVGPQFYKTNVMFFLRVTNAIPFISSKTMNVIQVCLLISLCLTLNLYNTGRV